MLGVVRKGYAGAGRTSRGIALVVALALSACSSAGGSPATTPTLPSDSASPSPTVTPSSTPEPSREEQIASFWAEVQDTRLALTYADADPTLDDLDGLASPEAGETLLALIEAARGDLDLDLVDSEYWPDVALAANGSAVVSDCVIVASRPTAQPEEDPIVRTQVWTATIVSTADGLQLTDVGIGQDNCVPSELNEQLLDAYRAYHEAWTTAWDPPDPEHPLLDATTTGERLAGIRGLLEQDREAGVAFRDPHDPSVNAVVFDLGIGRATVSDCHPADPGYGAYDVETGERLDDEVAPVTPGELHLTSVDLVRMPDGTWKVEEAALLTNSNCEPRGTSYVVAS